MPGTLGWVVRTRRQIESNPGSRAKKESVVISVGDPAGARHRGQQSTLWLLQEGQEVEVGLEPTQGAGGQQSKRQLLGGMLPPGVQRTGKFQKQAGVFKAISRSVSSFATHWLRC